MLRRRALILPLIGAVVLAPVVGWYSAAPASAARRDPHLVGVRPSIPPERTARQSQLVERDFWSQSLGVRKRVLVWLPPSYGGSPGRRYPVAYYLHGVHGSERDWTRLGGIDVTADSLIRAGMPEMILVMPDGDDGWYTTWNSLGDYPACRREFRPRNGETVDQYCVPWLHYDDYIAHDLVQFVDRTFRTQARRERRGIAGLSMGGYGAFALALSYPEVFGVAASHSGTLAPLLVGDAERARPAGSLAELEAAWGALFASIRPAFGPDTAGWSARDPARLLRVLNASKPRRIPALMLDVGTGDQWLTHSRAFRRELQALNVAHSYAEWPGGHDWTFWRRHAAESLRFIAEAVAR